MSWFDSLFKRNAPSAQVAKSRLKVAIQIDRNNLSPELMTILQEDIVRAISQRLDIDTEGMRITTERGEGGQRLIADIPYKRVRANGASGD
jgi:cell division topological specificity factor MinE